MIRRWLLWLVYGAPMPLTMEDDRGRLFGGMLRDSGYEPDTRYPRAYRRKPVPRGYRAAPRGLRVHLFRDRQIQKKLKRRA